MFEAATEPSETFIDFTAMAYALHIPAAEVFFENQLGSILLHTLNYRKQHNCIALSQNRMRPQIF